MLGVGLAVGLASVNNRALLFVLSSFSHPRAHHGVHCVTIHDSSVHASSGCGRRYFPLHFTGGAFSSSFSLSPLFFFPPPPARVAGCCRLADDLGWKDVGYNGALVRLVGKCHSGLCAESVSPASCVVVGGWMVVMGRVGVSVPSGVQC